MKTKLPVLMTALALVVVVSFAGTRDEESRIGTAVAFAEPSNLMPGPEFALIDDLDRVIQQRFLAAPNFGMRRIGPNPHAHLNGFAPTTEDEKQAVSNLQKAQWKVGLYLIGRTGHEYLSNQGIGEKRLRVEYKLNYPLPITRNVRKREFADPKRIQDDVDRAFEKFRVAESYDFSGGKWSYLARPVRAMESCLKCHLDSFVTARLGAEKFEYRPRRAGDAIGVLVYAISKKQ